MTKLVYLHTFYPDMVMKEPIDEFVVSAVVKTRDQEHYHWIMDHAVTMYPKSLVDHQYDRPLFTARTKTNSDTAFLFIVKERGNELFCKAVYRGEWSTHLTVNAAQNAILSRTHEQ